MNDTVMLVTACVAAEYSFLLSPALGGERDFRNAFPMMSKEGQEELITGLMERKKCARHEAMRVAVEEWRHQR
jgi:hypothetical protein